MRAAKGVWGGVKSLFRKPARLLPLAASLVAAPFTGGTSLAWLPAAAAATTGAIQGATTDLWGERGVGGAVRGGMAGLGQGMLGAGTVGGIQNIMSGPGVTAGGGMLGGAGTGMGGAAGTTMPAGNLFAQGFGQASGFNAMASQATSMLGGGQAIPTSGGGFLTEPLYGGAPAVTPGGAGGAGGFGGMLGNIFGGGAGAPGGGGALTPGAEGFSIKNLLNPMTILGSGILGMGQTATAGTPPDIGPTASKWLTADTVTRAGEVAKTMAESTFGAPWEPSKEIKSFMEVQEKDIHKQYKRRHEEMDKMGLSMSEQWMSSGERLEMHKRMGEEETTEVNKMKQEWLFTAKREHATRQYSYVMDRLRVDDQTKRDLLYADLVDVIWKYQLKREDVLQFREIAANAGMYMIAKGTGLA